MLIYSQCEEAALFTVSLDFIRICEFTARLGNAFFQYSISVHCFANYRTACPGIHAASGSWWSFDAHPSVEPEKA